jgi:PTS system mannose-specific IIA component
MVGIVLITHGSVGEELIATTESIGCKLSRIQYVAINREEREKVDKIRQAIATAIKKVDLGQGVLILTDMFGGTPSNISLSFLEEGRVEVLCGVNLPMLLKLSGMREKDDLMELTRALKDYGKKSIVLASDFLTGKER